MTWVHVVIAVLVLALGVWIGLGAPGWPHQKPIGGHRKRLEKRPINPIAWARPRRSERRSPRFRR